jgi:Plasmid pRiA4b ORF-3-like protein
MPGDWMTIRVSLLGGGGIVCDPPPGRVMLVGPRDTFADLAEAIDSAFARWDRSHLHVFELTDGRRVSTDPDQWDEDIVDETKLHVTSSVGAGDRFQYVFDLGDDWRHDCEVTDASVDPVEMFGELPPSPIPIWGWGWIPDQYGRRTEDGGWIEESEDDTP